MRRSVRYVIAIAICGLLAAVAYVGFSVYEVATEGVQDCYAQWWVTDMVIDYMDRNEGAWPGSWEDLREPYEILAGRSGQPWSFDDLRSRCAIDFEAEPEQLVTATQDGEGPPFRVIRLRNGKERHWEGAEPNQIILDYLLKRAARPDNYRPPKRPVPEERQARLALLELGAGWDLDKEGRVTTVRLSSHPGDPRFNDDAMMHLKTLRNLRGLDLGYSDVTDRGLSRIQSLSELRWIYLYGTQVTDDGLRHVRGLTNLETLVLADNNFTDRCLEHISTLPNLKLLNLNGCRITDSGVEVLHQHSNLERLMLYDTEVTSQGIEDLERALPNCKVER